MKTDILLEKCNWSLLRIFRVIVQEGSLNKAANKLFLTQSAISQSLKRLEEQ
ncbi:LysR family transcriptional regulator, partial [Acinetobacter soli]